MTDGKVNHSRQMVCAATAALGEYRLYMCVCVCVFARQCVHACLGYNESVSATRLAVRGKRPGQSGITGNSSLFIFNIWRR